MSIFGLEVSYPVVILGGLAVLLMVIVYRRMTRPKDADKKFAQDMLMGMVQQVLREQDMVASRGHEPIVVRLAPQLPIREGEPPRSWLGGGPAMPESIAWPEINSRHANFLAQICCADLPAELWDGLGPREGWLAFFIHSQDCQMQVLHVRELGPMRPGPVPDGKDSWFKPASGLGYAKLPHAAQRAFPHWPVDLVTVTPGGPDPRKTGGPEPLHEIYRTGYDLASPEHRPFDWPSTLAMLDIAEARVTKKRDSIVSGTLEVQLASARKALADAEQASEPPTNLAILQNKARDLPILIEAVASAGAMLRIAASRLEDITATAQDRSAHVAFSEHEIAPIMDSLRAIEWLNIRRGTDKARGPGAEDIQSKVLPLTVHDADATLWAHDFENLRFDWAKHAYSQSPASLPAAVRVYYEQLWRDVAAREMAGMGHVPFNYVHQFDAGSDITLIELPTSDLMSWMFGDVDNLVVTMKKADLAAGNFDALNVQISN